MKLTRRRYTKPESEKDFSAPFGPCVVGVTMGQIWLFLRCCQLCDLRMTHQRALDFRCAESVTSHVQNIINTPDDPKITVFIAAPAVAREIITFKFAPVLLSVARIVAVDRAQHRRPWPADNQ